MKKLSLVILLISLAWINVNGQTAIGYYNSGTDKGELGDTRGAIQDYNKATELNPNFTDAYMNRGISKFKLGDINGSCLDWSKADELGSADAYDLIKEHCK